MKEEYTVLKWQKECDAPPVSGSSGGGESISVYAEGDELVFRGGGRVFKTNQCYDQMPTLQRETHTRSPSGREWRTRCTTPPNDPRHAVMNTLVVATTDTHIDVVETGRYESQLAGGLCTADIKRSRSFDLVARAGAAAPLRHPPPPRLRPRRRPGARARRDRHGRLRVARRPDAPRSTPVAQAASYRRELLVPRDRPRLGRVRHADPHDLDGRCRGEQGHQSSTRAVRCRSRPTRRRGRSASSCPRRERARA